MTRLLVATRNRGKQAEFRALLAPSAVDIVFPGDLGLPESAAESQLEVHLSFQDNARAKSRWFAAISGLVTLADDSGLEVAALDNAPGVHSRRFSGQSGSDDAVSEANNAELLRQLSGVTDDRRVARYRCALVLTEPASDVTVETVSYGTVDGRILRAPRGTGGFGYDPLFFSDELGATFGEATEPAKRAISHRGRAFDALIRAVRGGDQHSLQLRRSLGATAI